LEKMMVTGQLLQVREATHRVIKESKRAMEVVVAEKTAAREEARKQLEKAVAATNALVVTEGERRALESKMALATQHAKAVRLREAENLEAFDKLKADSEALGLHLELARTEVLRTKNMLTNGVPSSNHLAPQPPQGASQERGLEEHRRLASSSSESHTKEVESWMKNIRESAKACAFA
jgi:hypothetical protein